MHCMAVSKQRGDQLGMPTTGHSAVTVLWPRERDRQTGPFHLLTAASKWVLQGTYSQGGWGHQRYYVLVAYAGAECILHAAVAGQSWCRSCCLCMFFHTAAHVQQRGPQEQSVVCLTGNLVPNDQGLGFKV